MIMKASQGHQRIPSASVLAGKIKTLGFEVTHDWMQPTDDISQQNTVGIIFLLAGWLRNLWLTDWKIYWTQNNCIKLCFKFLIQGEGTNNFHKNLFSSSQ